jgi:hypothetical protein
MFTKVHMVYSNVHLMKRDMEDFESYWLLLDCESQIGYHVGIDFKVLPGELLVIDEADAIMFADPTKFFEFSA